MTCAGFLRSTRISRAARWNSASAEIPSPGAITPPRYSPLGLDDVEGRRGAEIENDHRRAETVDRGDGVHDAVGPDLVRVARTGSEARF